MKDRTQENDPRAKIPGINQLVSIIAGVLQPACPPHDLAVRLARVVAQRMRTEGRTEVTTDWMGQILEPLLKPGPRPVINGTGILLHTNLGRAPLDRETIAAALESVSGYTDLELDHESGKRGHRDRHFAALARLVWGVGDATLVNNAAAAVGLTLAALAEGRETLVSRGELVEIGGSFRLPAIMEFAGTKLAEVGTTNKTNFSDYEFAISSRTACILKTHTSNYRIEGFSQEVPLAELTALGKRHGIPVVMDLGSGLSATLGFPPVPEPTIEGCLKAHPDVLVFSGDKLFGNIQAGIIVGDAARIQRLRKHPMMRMVRLDKLNISIVCHHLQRLAMGIDHPLAHLASVAIEDLWQRAWAIAKLLPAGTAEVVEESGYIGGGSLAGERRPSVCLALNTKRPDAASRTLRERSIPIIAHIHDSRLRINLAGVFPHQDEIIAEALGSLHLD